IAVIDAVEAFDELGASLRLLSATGRRSGQPRAAVVFVARMSKGVIRSTADFRRLHPVLALRGRRKGSCTAARNLPDERTSSGARSGMGWCLPVPYAGYCNATKDSGYRDQRKHDA